MTHYTPTEKKILNHLNDGMRHKRRDLMADCMDELASRTSFRNSVCRLRKKLRPKGQDIVCELADGTINYRHIRLLHHNNE